MENTSRNKWQFRGIAIVLFALGFTSGIMAMNAYRAYFHRGGGQPREDRFEQLASRLQLNQDQKTKVQQVFSDTRQQLQALRKESEPRISTIRQQTDQRLQEILTPAQWAQFQQERSEMRGRRGRGGDNGP